MNKEDQSKPILPAIEADRLEAIARAKGAEEARAQGGDPVALNALMTVNDGVPTICGHTLTGIRNKSYTAACMVALELWNKTADGVALSSVEKSVAFLQVITDPKKVWQTLQKTEGLEAFLTDVRTFIFNGNLTMSELNEINRGINDLIESATREEVEEDEENFRKPAEPATSATS